MRFSAVTFGMIIGVAASSFAFQGIGVDTFTITRYGAVGDGRTLCTDAIQKAIDECENAGGGTVYVPSGIYLTGSLMLKSGVDLYLERNSVILGSTDLSDYLTGVLIFSKDQKDITLEGDGTIDGNGKTFWGRDIVPLKRPGGLVRFENCRNISVRNVFLTNSPKFTLYLDKCSQVHIDAIRIRNSLDSPNTDGIDIANTSSVFISNSYIETGDDAICLKSNKMDAAVEDIIVSNCIIISDDTALKLGTGSRNRISDCTFSNIVIPEATNGIGLFMDDGGVFENLQFSNINMATVATPRKEFYPSDGGAKYWRKVLKKRETFPIFIDSDSRTGNDSAGTIQNISFRGIMMDNYDGNCLISGRNEKHIRNITLTDIRMNVSSEKKFDGRMKPRGNHAIAGKRLHDYSSVPSFFTFVNVDGLTLSNVEVECSSPADTIAIHCIFGENVNGAKLNNIGIDEKNSDTMAVVRLVNSRDVLVSGYSLPGTRKVFVETAGDSSRNICY